MRIGTYKGGELLSLMGVLSNGGTSPLRNSESRPTQLEVQLGDLRIASLLFADDVDLLASSGRDLQHTLGQFAVECEAVRITVSTYNYKAVVLNQKVEDSSALGGSEWLPQMTELKYL